MPWRDEWPSTSDGNQYDGKRLLSLVASGESPFDGVWDVKTLIQEIEDKLNVEIIDIPTINKGSNNYGFHLKTANGPDLVARLARGDVNMPEFEGFPIERQAPEARFEVALYELLFSEPKIPISHLIHYRIPVQHVARHGIPQDLAGRRLFVFERAEGEKNVWNDLGSDSKFVLLDQLASVRAALFSYDLPLEIAGRYLHDRLFEFKPESLSVPVTPTRDFWIHVLESKIKATIRNLGDMIGWESDEEIVGPIAFAAKQSLLRAIPYLMPPENSDGSLYRLVLEHGDFGIHNTSIAKDVNDQPLLTSLYDWETACIAPALLSDPLVVVSPVDLTMDEDGRPSVTRLPENPTSEELETYATWARYYIEKLCTEAPDYEAAMRAGKDVRHLWFALRDWRGESPEEFFGELGAWAEKRMKECRQEHEATTTPMR